MKRKVLLILLILIYTLTGCSVDKLDKDESKAPPIIARYPEVAKLNRDKIDAIPQYKTDGSYWQIDLRQYDLSNLDITDEYNNLKYADFDDATLWPKKLPKEFDPEKIMKNGKDPGLNLKKLHKKGITGKGVGIAIIDSALLVNHNEYKNRLRVYEEIHCLDENANMHGSAVASIAVGQTSGVAPQANLYYIAETPGVYQGEEFIMDYSYVAQSIDRILEINDTLPQNKKIRVIAIALGWSSKEKGYEEVIKAVERAKNNGIFVVTSSLAETYYGFNFMGLGRDINEDPNKFNSYRPGLFWNDLYYNNPDNFSNYLLVPMDSRSVASPTGVDDYVFYRRGGLSWSIPYIAGLYALSCQVKPDITPEEFLKAAVDTGEIITYGDDIKYELSKIVNPEKLIKAIKK